MDPSVSEYCYQPLVPASHPHGEMRVLTLLPGNKGSQLVCNLSHVPIRSPPLYEALSYTWGTTKGKNSTIPEAGDPKQMHTIVLNGLLKTVGHSLEVALQHLRDNLEARLLWVDALCIDQENDAEKSEQVAAMADIYKRSMRALAWLGEDDRFVDLAFDTLEETCWATKLLILQRCADKFNLPLHEISIARVESLIEYELARGLNSAERSPFEGLGRPKAKKSFLRAVSLVTIECDSLRGSTLGDIAAATWSKPRSFAQAIVSDQTKLSQLPDFKDRIQALTEVFFNRSYWERLWVVQELHSSPEVSLICGQRSIDMDLILLVQSIIIATDSAGSSILLPTADYDFVREFETALDSTLRGYLMKFMDQEVSFAQSCQQYSSKLCTDPRDAIFALLNISKPINIIPDYSKSVSEVYTTATRAIIEQAQNLNILCTQVNKYPSMFAGCPPSVDLPSWVPHYESIIDTGNLHVYMLAYEDQLFKGGGTISGRKKTLCVQHSRVLEIDGCFYGTIMSVQPRFYPEHLSSLTEVWSVANKLQPIVVNPDYPEGIPSSPSADMEIWSAMLMDQYPVADKVGIWKDKRLSQNSSARKLLAADLEIARNSEPPARLVYQLLEMLQGKTLCITSTGHIALVLADVKVGDNIFVARGATNPFVLRPAVADESYDAIKKANGVKTVYSFIGGSYVHGIMDGEVLERIGKVENGTKFREKRVLLI